MAPVNRYYKPAVYTPLITEVEYPFKEMFLAGKYRQDTEDAARQKEQELLAKDANVLKGVYLANGQFKPREEAEAILKQEQLMKANLMNLSSTIAGGERSAPEYQQALGQIQSQYNALHGPMGAFGREAENIKAYEEGQKNMAAIKNVSQAPWLALNWDLNKKKFIQGEVDYLDPTSATGAEYVDRQTEVDNIMKNIAKEGKWYANSNGKYIVSGTSLEVTPQKVLETFRAGFANSKLERDLLQEMTYNIEVNDMKPEDAQKIFNDAVANAENNALKYVYKSGTKSMKVDNLYGNDNKAKDNLREAEEKSTRVIPNVKPNAYGIDMKSIQSALLSGNLNDPRIQRLVADANSFFNSSDAMRIGQSTMSPAVKVNVIMNAINNTHKMGVNYKVFDPDAEENIRQTLVNSPDRMFRILSGPGAGNIWDATIAAKNLGYKSYDEMMKQARVSGLAKADAFGTGAGSMIITVFDKNNPGNTIEVAVSGNDRQRKNFGASSALGEITFTGAKNAFYSVGADYQNGKINFEDGAGAKDMKSAIKNAEKNHHAVIYEANNNVTGSLTDPTLAATVNVYKRNAEGEWVLSGQTTPDAIFELEYENYIDNIYQRTVTPKKDANYAPEINEVIPVQTDDNTQE